MRHHRRREMPYLTFLACIAMAATMFCLIGFFFAVAFINLHFFFH